MSSGIGYPDWQKIQQWVGAPLAQATGLALGAGVHDDGPFNLSSWASIVVAIKPTTGPVTVTVTQKINAGPASLQDVTTFVVPAGQTIFESVVLYGDVVTVHLAGSIAGTTVDYAVYPSNTTTNAQVLASAVLAFQKDDVLVASEPGLDFLTSALIPTLTDDAANSRVKLSLAHRMAVAPSLTNGAIANALDTVLTWAAPTLDNGGFWNAGNPSRFTVPAAGWYAVVCSQQYALNATSIRGLVFKVNGAFAGERALSPGGDGNIAGGPTHTEIFQLAAGSFVEAFTYQSSGGALAINGGRFEIVQLA